MSRRVRPIDTTKKKRSDSLVCIFFFNYLTYITVSDDDHMTRLVDGCGPEGVSCGPGNTTL